MKKPLRTTVKMDAVYKLIDEMNLTTKCRKNEFLIPRCILYNILYNQTKISLEHIGKLFHKNHATVMNGFKKYEAFMLCKDLQFERYKELIEREIFDFPEMHKEELEKTLIQKVLECENYFEMRKLQEELKQVIN